MFTENRFFFLFKQSALAILLLHLVGACALAAPPAAPSMTVGTSGQTVNVSWTSVPAATGYVLYYAPYPKAEYIGSLDMGTTTSFGVPLPPGAAFYVAIRARNSDGEGEFSNIGNFVIQGAGTFVLQAGDYWEYEWTSTTTGVSASGTSTTETGGTFRVTLGTPQVLGGKSAFPVSISGNASVPGKSPMPIWKYLASEGPVLLGTNDGAVYSTIFGGDAGTWKGIGFFSFFSPDLARLASRGTFEGNYLSTATWIVARSGSSGGCKYYPEVGQTLCSSADSSSFSESEYQKAGVGPVGYRSVGTSSGASSAARNVKTIELVKSSRVADDGTIFAGSPWQALPEPSTAPYFPAAAALNGTLVVSGGDWFSHSPPFVRVYDPNVNTWKTSSASGANVRVMLGVTGGSLYSVGTTSSSSALSLLRFDPITSRWQALATTPAFANPCGGASLANGNLALLDCSGVARMSIYIYSPATGRWQTGVNYTSIVLRPAVAAVGNDVYVMGGYSSGNIVGTMRRFRSLTGVWENLSGQMRTPRDSAVAVASGDKLYVLGGRPGGTGDAPDGRLVEIYDAASGIWSTGPVMPQNRSSFAASLVNGKIYVIGGFDSTNAPLSSAIVLTP